MNLGKTLALTIAALAIAAPAFAVPIAVGSALTIKGFARAQGPGGVTIDQATGLDFTTGGAATPGVAGALSSFSGTSSFASLGSCSSNCGTIQDLLSFSAFAGMTNYYVLSTGLSFDLNAPLTVVRTAAASGQLAQLVISGSGTFHGGGFDATPGVFTLTTIGAAVTNFSASTVAQAAAAIPEPGSLAILGASLAGVGLLRRKR